MSERGGVGRDRVALITGGSGGIGRAVAERLARDGMAVAVHYSRSSGRAEETVEEITSAGGRAIAEVVAAPRGRRPFRVHVNTEADGAHVADPVVDRVRAEFLRRAGLGDLLTVRAPAADEGRT